MINFLNSLPKRRSQTRGALALLIFAIAIAVFPRFKSQKTLVTKRTVASASSIIPNLVAAPSPTRLERLESDLKNRTLAERALNWTKSGANGKGLEITLPSDSLFQTGSATFDGKREPELRNLVQWLISRNDGFQITIESHTDDMPIVKHRKTFKSNWELSAARAGAVAGMFQDSSFPKSNLEAIGFADSRPVGSDRNQNRRIVLRLTDKARGGT
jgi:flagellar motor protein MotB